MRQMMDMIRQSNDVICNMTSKIKELEKKQIILENAQVKHLNVINDLKNGHGNHTKMIESVDNKLRQNELSVRQILVDNNKARREMMGEHATPQRLAQRSVEPCAGRMLMLPETFIWVKANMTSSVLWSPRRNRELVV